MMGTQIRFKTVASVLLAAMLMVITAVGLSAFAAESGQSAPPPQQRQAPPSLVGSVVRSDYVLGPGDLVDVEDEVMGDQAKQLKILSDGSVYLKLIGKVYLGGLTLDQANVLLNRAYSKYYVNPSVTVSVTYTRPVRVYVNGAVESPGVYESGKDLGPYSAGRSIIGTAETQRLYYRFTLTDLLIQAGGLQFNANTRDIKIFRSFPKQQVIHVDLFDLFVNGNVIQDFPLSDSDVVRVDAIPKEQLVMDDNWQAMQRSNLGLGEYKVNVVGSVARPGSYPIRPDDDVLAALAQAGGFTELADQKKVYILRANSTGQVFKKSINLTEKHLTGEKRPDSLTKLLPNDVVLVDESGSKRTRKAVLGFLKQSQSAAMFPLFSQLFSQYFED